MGRFGDDHKQSCGCQNHPQSLEQPSNKKLQSRFFNLIESAISSAFDNSVEEKTAQSSSPQHNHSCGDVLLVAGRVVDEQSCECEGDVGEGSDEIVEGFGVEDDGEDEGDDLDGEGEDEDEPEEEEVGPYLAGVHADSYGETGGEAED